MEKNPLIVIFLGKSGAGKGTQVNLIKEKYNLEKISSGDLLRERKKTPDFTGEKISKTIDNGGIVLTPVIFKLWMEKLEEHKKNKDFQGLIFDGSPRKIKEAYLMEEALEWYEWNKNIKVILLDISDEEVVKRIALRKICPHCGNIIIDAPDGIEELVCSQCGSKLERRPEDTEAGVRKRLEWFQKEVQPVINYYEEAGCLIRINGEQSIENVFQDIIKSIQGD